MSIIKQLEQAQNWNAEQQLAADFAAINGASAAWIAAVARRAGRG